MLEERLYLLLFQLPLRCNCAFRDANGSGGRWVPIWGREGSLGSQAPTDGPSEEILLQNRGDWLGEPPAESFRPGRRWVLSDPGEEQRVADCLSLVGDTPWVPCQVEEKL